MAERRRVALLVESSRSYGRGLLRGIAEYARVHDSWSVTLDDRGLWEETPAWFRGWSGDGVIARADPRRVGRRVTALGAPVVYVRGAYSSPLLPLVDTDEEQTVRLAFDHLAERGFREFAFCGFVGVDYSDFRTLLFTRLAGGRCHVYHPPAWSRGPTAELERANLSFQKHLAGWLKGLPKPVGVMACNDIRGQQVLDACRDAGVAVPDEVAVVGVDNDELLCDLCTPALSSVVPDTRRIGYEAAALLDRLMAGGPPPAAVVRVPPLGVVTRRSTDVLAVDNPEVAAAARFIRDHFCEGITVRDVLAHVGCSRSTLERGFARAVGRTPKAEIIRLRLERVKQLLAGTDYPLARVAVMTGFEYPEYLSVVFRREIGQTPGQYRQSVRRS